MMQNKRSFRSILAILLTVALLVSLTSVVFAADAGQKQITILGTSDMHGNIWGYSYEDNKETTNNGMARVYTYIQEVRKENPNTILVDGGDTIQGTILTDDIYNKQSGEHPVITAMNYMGYDAMTLGNHEFNFGLSLISRIKSQAKFPILAANATNKSDGKLLTGAAYTIVERDGVKVAIIGVTNPNIPTWDGDKVASVKFAALSSTVKSCIKEIGDKADIIMLIGADALVILTETDGLYTGNPLEDPAARRISRVSEITDEIRGYASHRGTSLGTGGMATKLRAAEMATGAGIDAYVICGRDAHNIYRLLDGDDIGTHFFAKEERHA